MRATPLLRLSSQGGALGWCGARECGDRGAAALGCRALRSRRYARCRPAALKVFVGPVFQQDEEGDEEAHEEDEQGEDDLRQVEEELDQVPGEQDAADHDRDDERAPTNLPHGWSVAQIRAMYMARCARALRGDQQPAGRRSTTDVEVIVILALPIQLASTDAKPVVVRPIQVVAVSSKTPDRAITCMNRLDE